MKDARLGTRHSALGTQDLRFLNLPRPVRVQIRRRGEEVEPVAVIEGGRRLRVARIEEVWQIEDEWWRRPVNRRYYRLALEGGAVRTIYHDRIADTWYAQRA